jgi:hypothetical protein
VWGSPAALWGQHGFEFGPGAEAARSGLLRLVRRSAALVGTLVAYDGKHGTSPCDGPLPDHEVAGCVREPRAHAQHYGLDHQQVPTPTDAMKSMLRLTVCI